MNKKIGCLVLCLGIHPLPLLAETTVPSAVVASTAPGKTNAGSLVISPGRYTASIMPPLNSGMAARLEKAFAGVQGLDRIDAKGSNSSIHFTVKNGSKVRAEDLQKLVASVDSGAVMSTPELEHINPAIPSKN